MKKVFRFVVLSITAMLGSTGAWAASCTVDGVTYSDCISGNTSRYYTSNLGGTSATFSGKAFRNNNTSDTGGIFISNTHTLTVLNSLFENNSASSGAAIGTYSTGKLLINKGARETIFRNNTATSLGGAISLYDAGSTLTLDHVINYVLFENNTATKGGAAINVSAKSLTITNSRFIGNKIGYSKHADDTTANDWQDGSAIRVSNDSKGVTSLIFTGTNVFSDNGYMDSVDLSSTEYDKNDIFMEAGSLTIQSGTTTLDGGIKQLDGADVTTTVNSGATLNFVNSGTGYTSLIETKLNNSGTVTGGANDLDLAITVTNNSTGVINGGSGTTNFMGDVINSGTINNTNGGDMVYSGVLSSTGILNNSGNLNLENHAYIYGSNTNTGKITIGDGGTNSILERVELHDGSAITGSGEIYVNTDGGIRVMAGGTSTVNNSITNDGNIDVQAGATLIATNGLTHNLTDGWLTVNDGSTLNVTDLIVEGNIGNSGTINLYGANNAFDNGSVGNTGTVKVNNGATLLLSMGEIAGNSTNAGVFNVLTGGTVNADGASTISNTVYNDGTINVGNGESIYFNNVFYNHGDINIAEGGTVSLYDAWHAGIDAYGTVTSGTIANDGILNIQASPNYVAGTGGENESDGEDKRTELGLGSNAKITGSGKVVIDDNARLYVSQGNSVINNVIESKGTIDIRDGTTLTADGGVYHYYESGSGEWFRNAGTANLTNFHAYGNITNSATNQAVDGVYDNGVMNLYDEDNVFSAVFGNNANVDENGNITDQAEVNIMNGATLTIINEASMENGGAITGEGVVNIKEGGTLTIEAKNHDTNGDGTVETDADSVANVNIAHNINNEGLILVGNGNADEQENLTLGEAFVQGAKGLIQTLTGGKITFNETFSNAGAGEGNGVDNQGEMVFAKDVTNTGDIKNSGTMTAEANVDNGATVTNSGTMTVASLTNNANSSFENSGGTVTITGTTTNSGNISNDNREVTNEDGESTEAIAEMTFKGNVVSSGSGAQIQNNGNMYFEANLSVGTSGVLVNGGTMTVNTGSVAADSSGLLNFGNFVVDNDATSFDTTGDGFVVSTGIINYPVMAGGNPNATVEVADGKLVFDNQTDVLSVGSILNNTQNGLLQVTDGTSVELTNGGRNDGQFQNEGKVNVSAGTYVLNSGVTGDGEFDVTGTGVLTTENSDGVTISNDIINTATITTSVADGKDTAGKFIFTGNVQNGVKANETAGTAADDGIITNVATGVMEFNGLGGLSNTTAGTITNQGTMSVAGSLSNSGSFTNESGATFEASHVNNSGSFVNSGEAEFDSLYNTYDENKFVNNEGGVVTIDGEFVGSMTNNGDVYYTGIGGNNADTIAGTGNFYISDNTEMTQDTDLLVNNIVYNAGTVTETDSSFGIKFTNAFNNGYITYDENDNEVIYNGAIDNIGTGTFFVVYNNAESTIKNSGTMNITGNLYNSDAATVNNTGTMNIEILRNSSAITNSGSMTINVSYSGAATNQITNSGSMAINNGYTSGTITNTAKATTDAPNNKLILGDVGVTNGGKIVNSGDILVNTGLRLYNGDIVGIEGVSEDGKKITYVGTLNIAENATLSGSGSDADSDTYNSVANAVENKGTISTASATDSLTFTGKVTNWANALISNIGEMIFDEVENNGTVTNSGEMTVASLDNVANGTVTNSGTMEITGLTNNATVNNTGTMTVASLNNNAGGSVTNNSGATMEVATLNNNSSTAEDGTVTKGTVSNAGTLTVGVLDNDGTISGTGTLVLTGDGQSDGSITQNTLTFNNGAVLSLGGAAELNVSSITNDGNGGTLNVANNGTYKDYNVGDVNLTSALNFAIDMSINDVASNDVSADTLTGKGINANKSEIVISSINMSGFDKLTEALENAQYSTDEQSVTVNKQILYMSGYSYNVDLVLAQGVLEQYNKSTIEDMTGENEFGENEVNININDKFGSYGYERTTTTTVGVTAHKAGETNKDTIEWTATVKDSEKTYTSLDDNLRIINTADRGDSEKTFVFNEADETFVSSADAGTTVGTLVVQGVADENGNKSTINATGTDNVKHNLFVMEDGTKVTLQNVSVTGASSVANVGEGAELVLDNVDIVDNTSGVNVESGAKLVFNNSYIYDSDSVNNGVLTLRGNNSFDTYLEGIGSAVVESGTTEVDGNTKFKQNNLTVNTGAKFESSEGIIEVVNLDVGGTFVSSNIATVTGTLTNKENALVKNDTEAVFEVASLDNKAGATVTNSGDFDATTVENSGTITNSGTLDVTGTLTNNGTVTNNSGTMEVGTLTNKAGASVTNNSAMRVTKLDNVGEVINNENTELWTNELINSGTITNNSGSISTNGGLVVSKLNNTGTISGTGTLVLTGDGQSEGNITQNTLTFNNGSVLKLGGAAELNVSNLTNDGNGGRIDSLNDATNNYVVGTLGLSSALEFAMEMDLTNKKSDTLTLTNGNAGSGTIKLSTLELSGYDALMNSLKDEAYGSVATASVTQEVLVNANTETILVATDVLSDYNKTSTETLQGADGFSGNTINFDDVFGGYEYTRTTTETAKVVGSDDGLKDSIEFKVSISDSAKTYTEDLDNLNLINTYDEETDKVFLFKTANDTFVSSADAGTTYGNLTVQGYTSGSNTSTINATVTNADDSTTKYSLFDIIGTSTVTLNNVKVTGAEYVAKVDEKGSLVLNNVEISGNTDGIINNVNKDGNDVESYGLILKGNNTLKNNVSGTGDAVVVNGKTTNSATFAQNGLTVNSGAEFDNTANHTLNVGWVGNNGTLTNNGTASVTGTLSNRGQINNGSQFDIDSLTNNPNGKLTNTGSLVINNLLNYAASSLIENSVDAEITNSGTLTINGGTNNGAITNNSGATTNFGGDFTNNSTIANAGDVNVNVGKLTLNGGNITDITTEVDGETVKQSGTVTIANGATLESTGNHTSVIESSVTNKGNISIKSGNTLKFVQRVFNEAGAEITNEGTASFEGEAETDADGNVIIGSMNNSGSVTNDGVMTISSLGNQNGGVITNNAAMTISGGINAGTGSKIVNTAKATEENTDNKLVFNSTFSNQAEVNNTGDMDITSGTFGMSNGAKISGDGNLYIGQAALSGSGEVNNVVTNEGSISTSGTLTFTNDVTNKKKVTNSGTMNFANLDNVANGTVTNSGDFDATTVENGGTITNSGTLDVTGTLTNSGTVTNNSGTMTVGTLTNSSIVENDDKMTVTTLTNSASGKVVNVGEMGVTTLENYGLVENSGTSGMTVGTLNNYADSTITNTGILTVSGLNNLGTIADTETRTGTLVLKGNGTSEGNITQNTLTFNNGSVLSLDGAAELNVSSITNDDNGGTLNSANGVYNDYSVGKLGLASELNFAMDMGYNDDNTFTSDTLSLNSTNAGSGTVVVSDLTIKDFDTLVKNTTTTTSVTQTVLKNANEDTKLELSESVLKKYNGVKFEDEIVKGTDGFADTRNSIVYNEEFGAYEFTRERESSMQVVGIGDVANLQNAIEWKLTVTDGAKTYTGKIDNLRLINEAVRAEGVVKEFLFNTAQDTFTSTDNAGTTVGTLVVQGVADGSYKSTINATGTDGVKHSLFDMGEGTKVTLNNVNVTGASSVANVGSGAELVLNNATINGGSIRNNGTLTLEGTNELKSGVSGVGSTIVNSGKTTNSATFAQSSLTINTGAEFENQNTLNITTLDNSGTLRNHKNAYTAQLGTVNNKASGKIINETYGYMNISTLNNYGSFEQAYVINNQETKISLLNNYEGGKVTNNNSNNSNSVLIINGGSNEGEITNISGAKLGFGGDFENKSEIANAGNISTNGTFTLNGGSITGDGTFTVGSTGTAILKGVGSDGNTINNNVSNNNKILTEAESDKLTFTGNVDNYYGLIENNGTMIFNNVTNKASASTLGIKNYGNMEIATLTNYNSVANAGTMEVGTLTNTAGTISNDATLNINGGSNNGTITNNENATTNLNGDFANSGEIANAGTLNVTSGTADDNNTLTLSGGSVTGEGTLNIAENATLSGSGSTYNSVANTVENKGTVSTEDDGRLAFGLKVTNLASGLISNVGEMIFGEVENNGSISNEDDMEIAGLTNNATVTNTAGEMTIASLKNNNGAEVENSATLNVTNGTNDGTITNNENATTNFNGDFTNNSTIANAGDVKVNAGTLTLNGGNITGNTGTLNIAENATLAGSGKNTDDATYNSVENTVENKGTISTAEATDSLTFTGDVTNSGSVTNNGTMIFNNVTNKALASTLGINNNGTMKIATLTNDASGNYNSVVNAGTMEVSTLTNTAGSVVNNNTMTVGTFNNYDNIQNNKNMTITTLTNYDEVNNMTGSYGGSVMTIGTVNNYGKITNARNSNYNATLNATIFNNYVGASLSNSVDANVSGTLTNAGGIVSNTGTMTVATLNNNNSTAEDGTVTKGDVTNSGTLNVITGANDGTITNNSGATTNFGGDFANNGEIANADFTNNATIANAGTINVNAGKLTLNGGSVTGAGTLNIAENATLTGSGSVENAVENKGTISTAEDTDRLMFTGVVDNYNSVSNAGVMDFGALNNYAEASITNDGTLLAQALDNDGTINGTGKLALTGDGTSDGDISQRTLTFNNGSVLSLGEKASLTVDNLTNDGNGGTLNSANGAYNDYSVGKTNLASALNFAIDMDVTDRNNIKNDTLAMKNDTTSTGSIVLSSINMSGLNELYKALSGKLSGAEEGTAISETIGTQVLFGNGGTSLVLGSALAEYQNKELWTDTVTDADNFSGNKIIFDDEFGGYSETRTVVSEAMTVATSQGGTSADSIEWKLTATSSDRKYTDNIDNLNLINTYAGADDKEFWFKSADNEFKSQISAGTTSGNLTINGYTSDSYTSTINANTNDLFTINNGSTVTLNNVKVTNASSVANVGEGAELVLNNATISGNTDGITNDGTLTLKGTNTLANNVSGVGSATVDGTTTNSATFEQGSLTVNTDATFANNGTVTVGTLNNIGSIDGNGTLVLTGDSSSAGDITQNTLTFNNGAVLSLGGALEVSNLTNDDNGGMLNSDNGAYDKYNVGTLGLKSALNFAIEMDLANNESDQLILGSDAGKGTITLSSLELSGYDALKGKLNGAEYGSNAEVSATQKVLVNANKETILDAGSVLSGYNKTSKETLRGTDEFSGNIINFDDVFGGYEYTRTTTEIAEVVGSDDGLQDSIKFTVSISDSLKNFVKQLDNLNVINTYKEETDKVFLFKTAQDTFTSTADAGTTYGNLTVQGYTSDSNTSTINAAGHSLFEMGEGTKVTLNNVKVTGASSIANVGEEAELVLNNATISGNTGGIANDGTLTLKGTNTLDNDVSGVGSATVEGTTTNSATFEQGSLTVNSGAWLINDGTVTLANATNNGNMENDGNMVIKSGENLGTITNAGDMTLASEGQTFVNNATITNDGTLSAAGRVELYEGISGSGNITIANNAELIASGNDINIANSVTNKGTFTISEGKTVDINNDLVLDNTSGGSELENGAASVNFGLGSELNVNNYKAKGNPFMRVDVDVSSDSIAHGSMNIDGNVDGTTKIVLRFLNDNIDQNLDSKVGYQGLQSAFITAKNDTTGTEDSFTVWRVWGKNGPTDGTYAWKTLYNAKGDEEGNTWYIGLDKNTGGPSRPDDMPSNDIYYSEIPAYVGLFSAAVEQNRGIADSVARGLLRENGRYCKGAQVDPNKEVWIDTVYEKALINSPSDIDAEVKGTTIGVDLYHDYKSRYGIFGAYRDGEYDLSGKGDFMGEFGSEIASESWLLGSYYLYDTKDWEVMATIYGGKQSIDITTDDGVKASTDATQYGASLNVGKRYMLSTALDIVPNAGVNYSYIKLDDFFDNVGKTVEYDAMHFVETKVGVRAEWMFCNKGHVNNIYVEPSVLYTHTSGGDVTIGNLKNVSTYDNQFLGRLEAGAEYSFTKKLSGYGSLGYIVGKEYEAYDATVGLNYQF